MKSLLQWTLCISLTALVIGQAHEVAAGATAAEKCEGAKLKELAKYSLCRLGGESKAVKSGRAADLSKCNAKLAGKWARIEEKGGVACPTSGNLPDVRDRFIAFLDRAATAQSGSRFVDNGDGTVSDVATGLMWEQKGDGAGCLHCVDDTYTWDEAVGDWLSEVNGLSTDGATQSGLAGNNDWRLPSATELASILLDVFPCATSPCADAKIGPTGAAAYWTGATESGTPGEAWTVSFDDGSISDADKALASLRVRAVRSPLPGSPLLKKRVFVTSSRHTGNFGGVAAANAICALRAQEAALPGTYLAWLTDSTGGPATRFVGEDVPYVRSDGKAVSDSWDHLTSGIEPLNALVLDEHAREVEELVWTGTAPDGGPIAGDASGYCDDWSSIESGDTARVGKPFDTSGDNCSWTDCGGSVCSTARALLCFEQ